MGGELTVESAESTVYRTCRAMFAHRARRPRLVLAHQTRVSNDIDSEDRGEAARHGHCSGTPALRMPSRMGSSPARYVGSSVLAVRAALEREIEWAGLSARPALAAERASS